MKRCSTCNRTYTDRNLSFCIDDGTPLTEVPEDESTVVAYQPPPPYVPPGTAPVTGKRRRVWPWIVGLLGAFLLGAIGLTIALAVLAPRLMKPKPNANQAQKTESTERKPEKVENVNTPAPSNEEQVLAQLRDLENEWMVANINADKQKLDRILADEYVGTDPVSEGRLQGKAEYLRDIERDTQTEKWEMEDLKLDLAGDRATLSGKVTFTLQDGEAAFEFKDK